MMTGRDGNTEVTGPWRHGVFNEFLCGSVTSAFHMPRFDQ